MSDAPLYFEGVIVSKRVAFQLAREFDFAKFRRRVRGQDRGLDGTLQSLNAAAFMYETELDASARRGSRDDSQAEVIVQSLRTKDVAELAGVKPRTVRLAAQHGRLRATPTPSGRIYGRTDVLAWLDERGTNGNTHTR